MLDLRGRSCVVVGGGEVAGQKVEGLLAAGAAVTVIAPALTTGLRSSAAEGVIAWRPRDFREGDLSGAYLAFAATDSSAANRLVREEAERLRIPINAADDPPNCSFILPAIHRDGDLVVAVSSSGKAPAVAARLRDQIAEELGEGFGTYLDLLGELRAEVRALYQTFEERRRVWQRIARSEALAVVRDGDLAKARRLLRELIHQDLESLSAEELIARVLDRPKRAAISCSFQAGGLALLHMVLRYEPDIPVLFVDTGYHFPETLEFRDRLADEWGLNLVNLTAGQTVAEQETELGQLYRTDPDRCCDLRKVEPLYRALEQFDVWFTGLRRDQGGIRTGTRKLERRLLPTGKVVEKVNPLAGWTGQQVEAYLTAHGIPRHPLYEFGFASIGCAPCTDLPVDPADLRSGRWGGRKLECGLHTRAPSI
jgi:phosphoadenosine phosphosulfate reductase